MADGNMTARAHDSLGITVSAVAIDLRCDGFVAVAACAFHDLVIELRDLDGVWIFAAGEVEGMPKSVVGLDGIFPDDVVRSVTIVARSGVVMA